MCASAVSIQGRLHQFYPTERVVFHIDARYHLGEDFQHLHRREGVVKQVYADHPVVWVNVDGIDVLAEACLLRKI